MFKLSLSSLLFLLFFAGCSNVTQSLKQTPKVIENKETYITFYNQKLTVSPSINALLTPKDYKITTLNEKVKGHINGEVYEFNKDVNFMPYYLIELNESSYITSIKFKQDIDLKSKKSNNAIEEIANNVISSANIVPLLFNQTKFNVKNIIVYGDDKLKKNQKVKWDSFTFNSRDPWLDIDYHSIKEVKDIHIAISTLYFNTTKLNSYSYFWIPSSVIVEGIKASKIEQVIKWNLINRKDFQANEDLLTNIAKQNEFLFNKLRKFKANFNVDSYSIINLPENVNLQYAAQNMGHIIKTGQYKRKDGKTDIVSFLNVNIPKSKESKEERNLDNINTYENKNSIKETTANNPQNVSYEDFSKGLF